MWAPVVLLLDIEIFNKSRKKFFHHLVKRERQRNNRKKNNTNSKKKIYLKLNKMRAFIVLSCLAFAAARPEAGYSYQRPGGSGGISSGLSGISGSSFGIGHGGSSFGSSFSSGGSSSLSGFGGVCSNINQHVKTKKKIFIKTQMVKNVTEKKLTLVRFNRKKYDFFSFFNWKYIRLATNVALNKYQIEQLFKTLNQYQFDSSRLHES